MSIKMLREDLCRRQVQADQWPSDIASAVDVLINMIDRHRPLGQDGSHGDLHTPTCGCEPDCASCNDGRDLAVGWECSGCHRTGDVERAITPEVASGPCTYCRRLVAPDGACPHTPITPAGSEVDQ